MPWWAPLAIAAGGKILDKVTGDNGQQAKIPKTPKDMLPMRKNNIGLMNYLMGFNDPNVTGLWNGAQQPGAPAGQVAGGQGQGQMTRPTDYGTNIVSNNGGQTYGAPGGGPWGPTYTGSAVDRILAPQVAATMDPSRRAATPYGPTPQSQQGGMPGMSPSFSMGATGGASPYAGGQMNAMGGASQFPGMQPSNFGTPGGGASQFGGGMPNIGAGMMPNYAGAGGGYGMQPGGGFSTQLPSPAPNNPMLGRMESYFGPLGTPTSALQQQSLGGISQFLSSNPYGQSNRALQGILGSKGQDFYGQANNAFGDVKNANYFGAASGQANKVAGANYFGGAQKGFNQLQSGKYFDNAENSFNRLENYNPFQPAQGMLEGMFQQNPGEGVMNAMHPLYERALAEANQTGGRFGSANAILRSRALDDYSLQMQQAMQHGVDQQLTGAGVYGQMGNSLIGAREAAGQGLLGVGQGRMSQQAAAANGMLGIGQGQLQQGLGAGQLMLGVGQGQLSQGLGAAQGMLGVGQGRSSYDLGIRSNQLSAAGQLGQNQNAMFGNMMGAYGIGTQQAQQEAERQQQALAILLSQMNASQQASLAGSGA